MNLPRCRECRGLAVIEGIGAAGVPVRTCSACGHRQKARRTADGRWWYWRGSEDVSGSYYARSSHPEGQLSGVASFRSGSEAPRSHAETRPVMRSPRPDGGRP